MANCAYPKSMLCQKLRCSSLLIVNVEWMAVGAALAVSVSKVPRIGLSQN